MRTLRQRWHETWLAQGLPVPKALGEALLQAWQSSGRAYHILLHLREMLRLIERHADLAKDLFAVTLAAWFHDAIYEPTRSDNEARSAAWARECLLAQGLPLDQVNHVCRLIDATALHGSPACPDEALLVDADLAILGATPKRFAAYEKQIRIEYAWAPWALYRAKRREVLQHFLDRLTHPDGQPIGPPLYATPSFQTQFNAPALRNLTWAIQQLDTQAEEPTTLN
jgi:predicted metal-dependent HD superfamily phosphohydrolase